MTYIAGPLTLDEMDVIVRRRSLEIIRDALKVVVDSRGEAQVGGRRLRAIEAILRDGGDLTFEDIDDIMTTYSMTLAMLISFLTKDGQKATIANVNEVIRNALPLCTVMATTAMYNAAVTSFAPETLDAAGVELIRSMSAKQMDAAQQAGMSMRDYIDQVIIDETLSAVVAAAEPETAKPKSKKG